MGGRGEKGGRGKEKGWEGDGERWEGEGGGEEEGGREGGGKEEGRRREGGRRKEGGEGREGREREGGRERRRKGKRGGRAEREEGGGEGRGGEGVGRGEEKGREGKEERIPPIFLSFLVPLVSSNFPPHHTPHTMLPLPRQHKYTKQHNETANANAMNMAHTRHTHARLPSTLYTQTICFQQQHHHRLHVR